MQSVRWSWTRLNLFCFRLFNSLISWDVVSCLSSEPAPQDPGGEPRIGRIALVPTASLDRCPQHSLINPTEDRRGQQATAGIMN